MMMTGKIINLLKDGSIAIPKILFINYKKLKLDEKELVFLMYIINYPEFNPECISRDLNINVQDVLTMINKLSKKDIIKIKSKTVNKVREEYISFDELYNKLALIFMEEDTDDGTSIYDVFESEFGRTLSSMEYEIIGAWLDQNFTEDLILLALKEAVYNGVYKLSYIDKILYTWRKKGIKNKEDVIKNRGVDDKKQKKEIESYDWLNE